MLSGVHNDQSPHIHSSRRTFLIGASATGLAAVALGACSSDETSTPATSDAVSKASTTAATKSSTTLAADACVLTPELTAGPYYLDGPLLRRDITEDRPGIAVTTHFTVIDATTCAPLANAAVDIWHCDANGEYSGFNGNSLAATNAQGRNDKRFLRGVQLTDAQGVASFATIYPGWYEGRAIHIHLKVRTGGRAGKVYEGGHVAHVGQVFFNDESSDEIMKLDPYAAHTGNRTPNSADSIYASAKGTSTLTLKPLAEHDPAKGFTATITLAVDPSATPPAAPLF